MKMNRLRAVLPPCFLVAMLWFDGGFALAKGGSVSVRLTSEHSSGVSAKAVIAPKDAELSVTVSVSGKAGASYLPDIRTGTCTHAAALPEIPLAMVAAGGSSATVVDAAASDLRDGNHVIMLHALAGGFESLAANSAVACGAIPAVGSQPNLANTAPSTGVWPGARASRNRVLVFGLAAAAAAAAFIAWRLRQRGDET